MIGINQNNWLADALRRAGTSEQNIKNNVKDLIFAETKEKISRQFSYNYDYSSFTFTNLGDTQTQFLKKYIFENEVHKKLLKNVKNASDYGIAGMLLRVGKKSIISQNVFLVNAPQYFNEVLMVAYMTVDYIDLDSYNEQELSLMKLALNEQGKYELSYIDAQRNENGKGFDLENGKVQLVKIGDDIVERKFVYDDFDFCPLEILENNESAKGDWEYAKEAMRLFSKFDAIIEREWEYTKIQLLNNLIFNPDKTAREVQAQIEGGEERVHEVADPDGKLQSALSYLSSGGITTDIAKSIKENYKDEIRELTFAFGSMSGGNNKHTTEIVGASMDAFKYLFVKKEYFSVFVRKYFWKVLNMSTIFPQNKGIALNDYLEVDFKLSKAIEIMLALQDNSQPTPVEQPQGA